MSEQNKQPASDLIEELNKLGENLGNLLRGAWESEERRSVEREITVGLEQMSKKLGEAAEKVKTDAYVNNARQAAKDAYEAARVPQILEEMQRGVVGTIKRINEDLANRAKPAQEASAETVNSKPE
jgi:methyl-accepting chemotaxis protein